MLDRDALLHRTARRLGVGSALLRCRHLYTMGPRGAISVAVSRRWALPRIMSMAPIAVGEDGEFEVHMLVQSSRVLEGLWALYSLLHSVESRFYVVIHDDGTLEPTDLEALSRVFPGIRVIARAESDVAARRNFMRHSLSRCAGLRASHPLALKLFDPTLFARDESFILLDSDVLFFSAPVELLDTTTQEAGSRLLPRYNVDATEAYALPRTDIEHILGRPPLPRVNAGLLRAPRLSFERIESYLAHPGLRAASSRAPLDLPGWYVEQTLHAMELTVADARPLPPEYAIAPRNLDAPGLVTGHYCGGSRNQVIYHTRAVPRVATTIHWQPGVSARRA